MWPSHPQRPRWLSHSPNSHARSEGDCTSRFWWSRQCWGPCGWLCCWPRPLVPVTRNAQCAWIQIVTFILTLPHYYIFKYETCLKLPSIVETWHLQQMRGSILNNYLFQNILTDIYGLPVFIIPLSYCWPSVCGSMWCQTLAVTARP